MTGEDYTYTPADVDSLREQVRICEALTEAHDRWPEISSLVFGAETRQELVELLAERLAVTEEVATAVSEMQILRLSRQDRSRLRGQLDDTRAELARAVAQLDG